MSYEIGMQAVNLQMPDEIPHTEYCDHPELIRQMTGLNPADPDPAKAGRAWQEFYRTWKYDIVWNSCDGMDWKGRTSSMGHAEYMENGSDYNNQIYCPFKTEEDVLNFDAVQEFGLPDVREWTEKFGRNYREGQKQTPFLVFPGGYYNTLFSACIRIFGWEMFLASVPCDAERFDKVLESIYKISEANFTAWSKTDIKVFICHDDIVWTSGAVFHPDWYRKYIFPRYKRLWKILKDRGIKILFCSDGNFDEFVGDIAGAGADGFIFEPVTDLKSIVEKYGKTKVIIGNADCRILTFKGKKEIEQEVRRCVELGKKCPGFFMAVGNHIPCNVPVENALYYFELYDKMRRR